MRQASLARPFLQVSLGLLQMVPGTPKVFDRRLLIIGCGGGIALLEVRFGLTHVLLGGFQI